MTNQEQAHPTETQDHRSIDNEAFLSRMAEAAMLLGLVAMSKREQHDLSHWEVLAYLDSAIKALERARYLHTDGAEPDHENRET